MRRGRIRIIFFFVWLFISNENIHQSFLYFYNRLLVFFHLGIGLNLPRETQSHILREGLLQPLPLFVPSLPYQDAKVVHPYPLTVRAFFQTHLQMLREKFHSSLWIGISRVHLLYWTAINWVGLGGLLSRSVLNNE